MRKKRIKQVINGLVAISVANTPTLFPDSNVILTVYIIGLCAICAAVYFGLNKITIKEK